MQNSNRKLGVALGAGLLLSAMSGFSPAQAAPEFSPRNFPLSGCAVTLTPDVTHPDTSVCLKRAEGRAAERRSPEDTFVQLAQNGPWPPSGGWLISYTQGGQFTLPSQYNDAASSWYAAGVCGNFYLNAAGTTPWMPYPKNASGNFPYGPVGNDQLSGVSVIKSCA
ncbi:hypothetical protein GCM10010521_32190 [Streptomyces rameus]|uniref:Secreted protein n=1 Tax=Streptomyces rameus TaxID=68261 RepID=A0ABP6NDM3_9ACTN